MRDKLLILGLALMLASVSGCTTWRVTDTDRTAVEELLLSTAVDRAMQEIGYMGVKDRKVYLDASELEAVDKPYLVSAIRDRLGAQGALMTPELEEAEIIIEARNGALGTDQWKFLLGFPSIGIPAGLSSGSGASTISARDPLLLIIDQEGVAKIALSSRSKSGGQQLVSTGPQSGKAYYTRWIILGYPLTTTDIPEKK